MATKKYVDLDGLSRFKTKADDEYVAKVEGKGLSTNDYTTAEKNKLSLILIIITPYMVYSQLHAT